MNHPPSAPPSPLPAWPSLTSSPTSEPSWIPNPSPPLSPDRLLDHLQQDPPTPYPPGHGHTTSLLPCDNACHCSTCLAAYNSKTHILIEQASALHYSLYTVLHSRKTLTRQYPILFSPFDADLNSTWSKVSHLLQNAEKTIELLGSRKSMIVGDGWLDEEVDEFETEWRVFKLEERMKLAYEMEWIVEELEGDCSTEKEKKGCQRQRKYNMTRVAQMREELIEGMNRLEDETFY